MLEEFSSFFIMCRHHSTRFDEQLVVRRLVVPHEQAHPHALLRLELEQLPEIEVAAFRQRPRRRRLPDEAHLVVHRPADDVYHVVRLEDGVADVLPARVVVEHLAPLVELDLRQVPFPVVGVLVQRDAAAVAEREVGVLDPLVVGVAGDAAAVERVVGRGVEAEAEAERRVGLVRPAVVADDGEPVLHLLARGDPVGGDGDGADELRAERVVVLDVELERGGVVGEGHGEALVPDGVLVVGDDAGARHHGAGDGERDVGVAGDDLPAVVAAGVARLPGGGAGGGRLAGGEAPPYVLGEHVHVWEQARLDHPQVEVPVEQHGLRRRRRLAAAAAGRRLHRRRRGLPPSLGTHTHTAAGPTTHRIRETTVSPLYTPRSLRRGFRRRNARWEREISGGRPRWITPKNSQIGRAHV